MRYENEMKVEFDSKSQNESFARLVISAFVAGLDPTIEEISDIKTAVSEAVTNAIIHGYELSEGKVILYSKIINNVVYIEIEDHGKGIEDVETARAPLYTSKPEQERSGLGFTVMETFMDTVIVESVLGCGTTIFMKKILTSIQMEEGKGNV